LAAARDLDHARRVACAYRVLVRVTNGAQVSNYSRTLLIR
jgi:hypothetical protein